MEDPETDNIARKLWADFDKAAKKNLPAKDEKVFYCDGEWMTVDEFELHLKDTNKL